MINIGKDVFSGQGTPINSLPQTQKTRTKEDLQNLPKGSKISAEEYRVLTTPEKQPGFVVSTLRGIASPFASVGLTVAQAGAATYGALRGAGTESGRKALEFASKQDVNLGPLGKVGSLAVQDKDKGTLEKLGRSTLKSLGATAEIGATIAGGGAAAGLAKGAIKQGVKQTIIQGGKQALLKGGIPSAVGALGSGIRQEKEAGEIALNTILSGAIGTAGYGALSAFGNAVSSSLRKATTPLEKQTEIVLKKAVDDGLKPVLPKQMTGGQRSKALQGLSDSFKIVHNKSELNPDGTKVLPKSVSEMRDAVEGLLPDSFKAYDAIARKYGDKVAINTTPVYKRMMSIATDSNRAKDVRTFAKEAAKDVLESNGASPSQLQQKIADFNSYFQDVGTPKAKSQVYATAAQEMLDAVEMSLDKVAKGKNGAKYRELRRAFGSLKNSLSYLNQAAKRTTNAPSVKNLITGEDILIGALGGIKGTIANVGRKGIQKIAGYGKSPDVLVERAFKALEKQSRGLGRAGQVVQNVAQTTTNIARKTPSIIPKSIQYAGGAIGSQLPKTILNQ